MQAEKSSGSSLVEVLFPGHHNKKTVILYKLKKNLLKVEKSTNNLVLNLAGRTNICSV